MACASTTVRNVPGILLSGASRFLVLVASLSSVYDMPGLSSTYLAHTSFQGPSSWLLTMHSATGSSRRHSGPSSGSGRSDSAKHSATGTRTSVVEEDGVAEEDGAAAPGVRFGDGGEPGKLKAEARARSTRSMSLTTMSRARRALSLIAL